MSLADELLADLEDDNDEDLEELKKEKDESDGKLYFTNFLNHPVKIFN
jgi:hypothetical protein